MNEPKLKPCPFCSGMAELKLYPKGELLSLRTWTLSHYRRGDIFCPAEGNRYFSNKRHAIKGWNRRLIERGPEVNHEEAFVRHIESHLSGDQVPICKICGKDIFTIAREGGVKIKEESK